MGPSSSQSKGLSGERRLFFHPQKDSSSLVSLLCNAAPAVSDSSRVPFTPCPTLFLSCGFRISFQSTCALFLKSIIKEPTWEKAYLNPSMFNNGNKNDCMVKLIESQAQDLGQYSFNQIIAIQARLSVQQLFLLKSPQNT